MSLSVGATPADAADIPKVPQAGPKAPEIGVASSDAASSLTVHWTPLSMPVDAYRVKYREVPDGKFAEPTAGTCGDKAKDSCTVTQLGVPGRYEFIVAAVAGGVEGDWSKASEPVMAIAEPKPPTRPKLSADGRVTWASIASDGQPIDNFDVYASAGAGPFAKVAVVQTEYYTLTGMKPGTSYRVNVVAVNAAGESAHSESSDPVKAVAAPGPPTITSVRPGSGSLAVTWKPGVDSNRVTGYVAKAGSRTCTTRGRACTITGLTDGEEYAVTVNGLETAPSRAVKAVPSTAPAAPSVTARAGLSSIRVSWKPGAEGTGIKGYVATAGRASCTVAEGVRDCLLGATAGKPVTVQVVALGAYGRNSAAGKSAAVKPAAPKVEATAPATDATLSTVTKAGRRVTFLGKGFVAHSSVTVAVYPKPIATATGVADASGAIRVTITLPAKMAAGDHPVVAYGIGVDGEPYSLGVRVKTTAPVVKAASVGLPVTGAPAGPMMIVALGLILIGGLARAVAREPRPCR